jgi:hypothetical protein
MLGEPIAVIAELIGEARQLDRRMDRLGRRRAADDGRLIEH